MDSILFSSRANNGPSGAVYRDVVLLPGPNTKTVPRQGTRIELAMKGFIKNKVLFDKAWDGQKVLAKVRLLFTDKMSEDVR